MDDSRECDLEYNHGWHEGQMDCQAKMDALRAEVERLRDALQDGVDDLASYADKKGAVKFAIEDVVFYMRAALAGKEEE